jgi:hypothetical protein
MFRKYPACSLPPSLWFMVNSFIFLSFAAADGYFYFKRVTVATSLK